MKIIAIHNLRILLTVILISSVSFSVSADSDELQVVWLAPAGGQGVQRYEKTEWAILLPPEVEQAFDNWIYNMQTGSRLSPAINPFDPDQLNVWADIIHQDPSTTEWTTDPEMAIGFYYDEFERNTTNSDPNQWDWNRVNTPYRFRMRWAPTLATIYSATIRAVVPGMGEFEAPAFRFVVADNQPSQSFVEVSPNGHYLSTADNKVFFPVGLNLHEGAFDCGCDNGTVDIPPTDNYACDLCYDRAENDPCCGLNKNNSSHRYKNWSPQSSVRDMCLPLSSYLKLNNLLTTLAESGANAYRLVQLPSSFDVEFEKVNNYYDRQYQAWEFDQLLDQTADLGLRLQLCMNYQHPIQQHAYGCTNWDFFDTDNCDQPRKSQAWGYQKEFNLTEPIEFFERTDTKEAYKKKLRYYIARWGYSADIYLIELFSEVNGVGSGTGYTHEGDGCKVKSSFSLPMRYTDDLNYRNTIGLWHHEMAAFIKTELKHRQHLITSDYAGNAPSGTYNGNNNPCDTALKDNTWLSPYIDVICFNNYQLGSNRFEGMATGEYRSVTCASDNYTNVPKPVLYGENGVGDITMSCDHTGFVKELVSIPFSGHASSGMSWDESEDLSHWHWMGHVNRFLQRECFAYANPGTESWVPGYATSNGRGNSKAECIYMRHTPRGQKKLAGVIMNRTWNWYTVGIGGYCDIMPQRDGGQDMLILPGYMDTLQAVSDRDEPLKIPGMEVMATYRTRYYDPISGEVIGEERTVTVDNKLRLENYPTLTADRPVVFFKSWRTSEGDDFERGE